jgi:adenosylcobinamide-GDP ribazoletransferase
VRAVLVATAFLTRIPVPVIADGTDVAGAARWFPLVGGAIGGVAAVIAWAMQDLLALPSALIATLLVGYSAWVTGAIHLDGLADTADGFGGGRTRDDVLRIMRDPLIGSYGATALLVVVATKVAAATALLDRGAAFPFLVIAPTVARWTISVLASWLPYARSDGGLGQSVTHQHVTGLLMPTMLTALITLIALRANALFAWMPALMTVAWMIRAARRRIGGVTGDVFGATVELTETAVLVSGVVLTGRA